MLCPVEETGSLIEKEMSGPPNNEDRDPGGAPYEADGLNLLLTV